MSTATNGVSSDNDDDDDDDDEQPVHRGKTMKMQANPPLTSPAAQAKGKRQA